MMNFRTIKALIIRNIYISVRNTDRLLDMVIMPLFSVITWGFLSNYLKATYGIPFIASVLAGSTFFHIFRRSNVDIPLFLIEDMRSGNLSNLFSSPISRWDKLCALSVFGILRSLGIFVIFTLITSLLFNFNMFSIPIKYLLAYYFSLMFFTIATGIALAGIILRFGTRVQVLAWDFCLLLEPIMGVYYPLSILPKSIYLFSVTIPATHVFQGIRDTFDNNSFNASYYMISIALNIIIFIAACMFYNYAFKHVKNKGKLIHAE